MAAVGVGDIEIESLGECELLVARRPCGFVAIDVIEPPRRASRQRQCPERSGRSPLELRNQERRMVGTQAVDANVLEWGRDLERVSSGSGNLCQHHVSLIKLGKIDA